MALKKVPDMSKHTHWHYGK